MEEKQEANSLRINMKTITSKKVFDTGIQENLKSCSSRGNDFTISNNLFLFMKTEMI